MFLAEFREEHLGDCDGSGRTEYDVEQAVGGGIEARTVKIVDMDHGSVNRTVIRASTPCRLWL